MNHFADEADALVAGQAGLDLLRPLLLATDVGAVVGALLESGNDERDFQLACAWKLFERDVGAILARATRHGVSGHLRKLEKHLKGLARGFREENSSPQGDQSAPVGVQGLARTSGDAIKPTMGNLLAILKADERWKGRIRLNSFADIVEVDGEMLKDHVVTELSGWFDREYGVDPHSGRVQEAVVAVAAENSYNPVVDYLESVVWDGEKRLDTWLTAFVGVTDSPLVRAYARKYLISAVARAFQPGCKADSVLILQGPQGATKSTVFAVLGGQWFRDSGIQIGSKSAYEAITGAWIYEFPELDNVRRRENSTVKAFLSAQSDHFRPAYGRNGVTRRRTVVFCGTSNPQDFLNDDTGSRRYWPVSCGTINIEALKAARDQLWAEAVAAYRAGEQWWLTKEEDALRDVAAETFTEAEVWLAPVQSWAREYKRAATTAFILETALHIKPGDQNSGHQRRVAAVMRSLGWTQSHPKRGQPRIWSPPDGLPLG